MKTAVKDPTRISTMTSNGCSKYAFGLLLLCMSAGCQDLNHTEAGALVGTGVGAAAGAIIGHQSGHRDKGALIGAASGALAGGLIGNAQDAREERDAAIAQAHAAEAARQADLRAMTNDDLIKMAQSGVSDEVIIRAVQTRGGRFDLSPDGIIALKANGVSDPVVLAIQKEGRPEAPTQVPAQTTSYTTVEITRVPQYVVVAPVVRPAGVIVVGHPRPGYPGHFRRHRW